MKKIGIVVLSICAIFLVTACGKGKTENTKNIEGVEISDNLTTYAYRKNFTYDYDIVIAKYDKEGNFKYYETTRTYYDGDALNEDCSDVENSDFKDLVIICEKTKDEIIRGYSFTDKTIADGILDSENHSALIERYNNVSTEEKAKEYFGKVKSYLDGNDSKNFLIIANEKVELGN